MRVLYNQMQVRRRGNVAREKFESGIRKSVRLLASSSALLAPLSLVLLNGYGIQELLKL